MKKICVLMAVLGLFVFSHPELYAQEDINAFVSDYKIGAKDLLEIKVFELPELNQTVRVSEDGSITLSLVGKVQVEGLTQIDLENRLAVLLEEKYVKNPQVSVFIKEYQSKRVAIIGAVASPGNYELIGRMNLLQLISKAGGLEENAADEIYILREGKNGMSSNISINLDDLMLRGDQKLNIPLLPNDVINIPLDEMINIYVFGEVTNPGLIEVKKSERITLLKAIAQAGGTTEGASKSGITIIRTDKDGKEIKITVNLKDILKRKKPDVKLIEGDVIFVPESIF